MESRDVAQGPIVEPRYFDVKNAARYLCMSQHALYHRVSRCQIPFARQGRSLFFDRHALDRWMSKGVKHGFTEERRSLVLSENDQRPVVPRVHGVRRQEGRRATGQRDRARHSRRRARVEEHDPELRGMVGRVSEDVHAAEVGEEP